MATSKLGVYYSDEAFGRGFADALKVTVAALGLSIPSSVELIPHPATADPNAYDWASDIRRLVDTNNETTMAKDGIPDLVSFATFPIRWFDGQVVWGKWQRRAGVTRTFHVFHRCCGLPAQASSDRKAHHTFSLHQVRRERCLHRHCGLRRETIRSFWMPIPTTAWLRLFWRWRLRAAGFDDPSQVTGRGFAMR